MSFSSIYFSLILFCADTASYSNCAANCRIPIHSCAKHERRHEAVHQLWLVSIWIGLDEVCELYLLSSLQAASIIIHLCATGFAAVHVRWRDVGRLMACDGFQDGILWWDHIRNFEEPWWFLVFDGRYKLQLYGIWECVSKCRTPQFMATFFFRNMMWVTLNEPLGVFPNHCETHEGHPKIL